MLDQTIDQLKKQLILDILDVERNIASMLERVSRKQEELKHLREKLVQLESKSKK